MHQIDFLQPIIVLLLSGILGIMLVQRFNLSPILGYFIAGIAIGPFGAKLVGHSESINTIAEIGVAFLLFDIGLHLSFNKLWESRRDLFGLGPFQIIGSSIALGGVTYAVLHDLFAALILGTGLSLSSTAVAMQSLNESREQNTPLGRSALAVLVGQDIFVIFLLILLPNLVGGGDGLGQAMGIALVKILLAFAAVVVVGRFLLRPVFEWITSTKNSEVFTASALLFVLASAWGISQLGLSLPLGAFLAGLALSESDFCYLVKTEIHPFRGLLLGLFFITVGMSLNWPLALQHLGTVLLILAGILTFKAVVLWAAARLMGFCNGFSIRLGLLLAQGSEFAFVLFTLAASQKLISAELSAMLQVAVGCSLALTPLLAWAGHKVANRIEHENVEDETQAVVPDGNGKVIITGFDAVGEEIARVLQAEGISYIAYDSDRQRIAHSRSKGFQVDFSDTNRPRTAGDAFAGKAKAVVILLEDEDVSLTLLEAFRHMGAQFPQFAASSKLGHFNRLSEAGGAHVYLKNNDTASVITAELMRLFEYGEEQISDKIERMRREQEPILAEAV